MRIRIHAGCFLLALASFVAATPAVAATKTGAAVSKEAAAAVPPLPNPAALAKMSEPQLKSAYIACDARASRDALSTIEAARCAMLHRELVDRVFGGDIKAFESWWENNRTKGPRTGKSVLPAPVVEPKTLTVPEKPAEMPEQNDKLHLPEDPRSPILAPDPVASVDVGDDAMRAERAAIR